MPSETRSGLILLTFKEKSCDLRPPDRSETEAVGGRVNGALALAEVASIGQPEDIVPDQAELVVFIWPSPLNIVLTNL